MSLREQEYQKFWRGFITYMEKHYPKYSQRSPSKNDRQIVPPDWFGGYIRIAAGISRPKENRMQVDVTLNNSKSRELTKEWYRRLLAEREQIEKELDLRKLDWKERKDDPESHIVVYAYAPPEEKYWDEQFAWLAETVDMFHKVFELRIKALPSAL
jgi:hypothetical protein